MAAYLPSVGGRWDADAGSAAVLALLGEQPEAVREWLDRPPQTNETGRAVVLLGGLRRLAPVQPVRLVELGASGGLNLLADRLRPDLADGLAVVGRLGCDLRPVDVRTTEGRLTLTAYVWPDQRERHERLRHALAVAQQHPVDVRRCGAGELLAGLEPRDGVVTVVWHSVVRQYLDPGERAQVERHLERLGAAATPQAPVAHLAMEPRRRTPDGPREMLVTLRAWPDAPTERVLGVAHPHGEPITWED